MKKQIALLAAALLLAGYQSNSQTLTFGGHTYAAIPATTLDVAQAAAATLGGHLVFVDSEAEYTFLDANFVKRGTGYWWTGTSGTFDFAGFPSGTWVNDDGAWNWYISVQAGYSHWNASFSTFPYSEGSALVMGKFQFSSRSTKWVTKFAQFAPAGHICQAIVEIE